MIFSVVCYLPLLEEEVAHKKIELSKKAANGEGTDGPDEDSESDNLDLFNLDDQIDWYKLSVTERRYVHEFRFSSCVLDDKTTPPPKL